MFWTALGIGLGISIVHAGLLCVVMVFSRSAGKQQQQGIDTLDLMAERNRLDEQKIAAMNLIAASITEASK